MTSEARSDRRWVGRIHPRFEDDRLIRGAGCFVADIQLSDCLHVAFFRSVEAHAQVGSLDVEDARAAPGVVAVFTGEDVANLPDMPVNPLIEQVNQPRFSLLAQDKVYAVGQPMVAVVAESAETAADAVERIYAELESLPPVLNGEGASAIFDDIPDNRAAHRHWSRGDVEAAFENAAAVVEARLTHRRLAPASLEPRGIAVEWHGDETMTVWLSTQTPHRARADLAAIVGLDAAKLRVVAPDVGGAFGMKASLYPEEILTVWIAARLKRSVRWMASRSEDMSSATHGRGITLEGALALAADGETLALRGKVTAPLGSWMPFSAVVPAYNAARILPGPYKVSAVDISADLYFSTTAPVGIYRGAGRPEAASLMERLMQKAARKLDMDPVAIRRRNLIPASAMPYATPTGETLDSGDYAAQLEKACALIDYPALKAERDRRRSKGEIVGIGISMFIEPTGRGWEWASVSVAKDGGIVAVTGSTAQGQGRETAISQLVADILCVEPCRVQVRHGDTQTAEKGIGALASRSTPIGASAVFEAAQALRDKARAAAADLLQADAADLILSEAGFERADGSGAAVSWRELAQNGNDPLCAETTYTAESEAWGSGACIAAMSIAVETGEPTVERLVWVDDAGTVINPALVDGQLVGGIAQGLGEALMERVVYDSDGQLLTGSFMDYAMPRADDMPPIELAPLACPTPLNALGAKGVGEAGAIGAPAAIVNAALDALAAFGVEDLRMPLTSERLWRAINGLPENEEDR